MTEDVEDVSEETIDLAAKTLTGDIRDWLLEQFRHRQKPWQQMTEDEQKGMVNQAEWAANDLVRGAVEIIAAEGRTTLQATLEQVVVKDGLKATLTLSKHDENRHELVDAQGKAVQIVVADAAQYQGQRAPVQIDKDEPELIAETDDDLPDPELVKAARQIGYDHTMAGLSTKDGPPYPDGSHEADAWTAGSTKAQGVLAMFMGNETRTNQMVSDAQKRIDERGKKATAVPDHPADDTQEFEGADDFPEDAQPAEAAE